MKARRAKAIFLGAVLAIACWVLVGQRAADPEITGKVTLKGTPPAEIPIQLDPVSARIYPKGLATRHYVVAPDGGLANAVVYIKEGLSSRSFPPSKNRARMEFRRCQIEPYVIGVRTNQPVEFRNMDPFVHNVHFTPKAQGNREFNAALIPPNRDLRGWVRDLFSRRWPWRGQTLSKSFPAPEVFVRLKCDVHPWEFGYINVMEHPYFAVTDKKGKFRFPAGLPAGKYLLEARHLKAGAITHVISIAKGEKTNVSFTLEVPPRP